MCIATGRISCVFPSLLLVLINWFCSGDIITFTFEGKTRLAFVVVDGMTSLSPKTIFGFSSLTGSMHHQQSAFYVVDLNFRVSSTTEKMTFVSVPLQWTVQLVKQILVCVFRGQCLWDIDTSVMYMERYLIFR